MIQNYLDLAGLTAYDGKIKEWIKSGLVDITDDEIRALFVTVAEGPADNEIWYTTVDGQIFEPLFSDVFGSDNTIVDNIYNENGVITTSSPINDVHGYRSSWMEGVGFKYDSISLLQYRGNNSDDRLVSIILPDSVTEIFGPAFYKSYNLETISVGSNLTNLGYGEIFRECPKFKNIIFRGSKAQWENITKDSSWNYGCSEITVHCTDGDIVIPANN